MKQSTKVGASRSILAMETNAASDPPGAGWTKIQFEEGHQPFVQVLDSHTLTRTRAKLVFWFY